MSTRIAQILLQFPLLQFLLIGVILTLIVAFTSFWVPSGEHQKEDILWVYLLVAPVIPVILGAWLYRAAHHLFLNFPKRPVVCSSCGMQNPSDTPLCSSCKRAWPYLDHLRQRRTLSLLLPFLLIGLLWTIVERVFLFTAVYGIFILLMTGFTLYRNLRFCRRGGRSKDSTS